VSAVCLQKDQAQHLLLSYFSSQQFCDDYDDDDDDGGGGGDVKLENVSFYFTETRNL